MNDAPNESTFPHDLFAPEAFEALLREWSGALVEYVKSVQQRPVMQWAPPAELEKVFSGALSEDGIGSEAVLRFFREQVLAWSQHHLNPRVAGHMVSTPLPVAVAADAAASLLNQGMGIWEVAPGPVALTQQVIGWLTRAAGFGPGADGVLTTGGTEANLTAILAARSRAFGPEVRELGLSREDEPVILASELAHYSIARSAGMVGIGRRRVTPVPLDGALRMQPERLGDEIERALAAGKRIVAVVATAGTTSAGTFDPIEEVAALCRKHGLWLHVDGAHGASVLFTERLRHLMAGVERADSLTWDPHKMLFVPGVLGTLLVADGRTLEAVFDERPSYLFGAPAEDQPRWNFLRKNLRCTQRFDALRLWAALQAHGRRTIGRLVERTATVAHRLWQELAADKSFAPLLEPSFNIVCFRFAPPGIERSDEEVGVLNEEIRTALLREGAAWLTTTAIGGRVYLRAAIMNPASTEADMVELVRLARRAGERLLRKA